IDTDAAPALTPALGRVHAVTAIQQQGPREAALAAGLLLYLGGRAVRLLSPAHRAAIRFDSDVPKIEIEREIYAIIRFESQ
ncbi:MULTISPECIES: hypothetical protein, partial [unclassified Burkholderia]|uniref:hypothetical protein n=1 Tax=Burkholderia sp. LMG 13014 TaxID=2709306 RepID=UPI001962B0DE